MIRGEFEDAGDRTPDELWAAYESALADVVATVGVDAVANETSVDEETATALASDESPELTVEEAAAILSLAGDRPSAEAIAAEARDILLMGMTTAVLDVETLSAGIDGELDPKEIQQKVEGRYPMTLAEYATLHQYVAEHSG